MRNLILLTALLLAPATAFATASWTSTYASGSAVMGEISSISFNVNNTSTGGEALTQVNLQLTQSNYDIDGGLAPVGWQVSTVDKLNRKVVFTATGSACPRGIAAGGSAVFTLRVIGQPANADQNSEVFITTGNGNKTSASFACATGAPVVTLGTSPTWKRIGIGASLSVNPTSTPTGATVTVTLTLTNRSTGSATLLPRFDPTITDVLTAMPAVPAAFTLLTSPSPTSIVLAQDATGVFQWTYRSNNQGVFRFTDSGHTSTNSLNSQSVDTGDLAAGRFPGTISIYPDKLVSGSTVRVTLSVRNNSNGQYLNVSPTTPSLTGTVTATLNSGPTPASQTSLPPGSGTSFVYFYTITGIPGSTFQFSGQANAVSGGFPISSDPVGSATGLVVTHTVSANPNVLSNSGPVSVEYTVFNGANQDIKGISLLDPDSHFLASGTPWSADTSGWTPGNHSSSLRKTPITSPNTAVNIQPPPGNSTRKFTFTFSSIATVTATTTFSHRFELLQADGTTVRVETPVSIFVPRTVPALSSFTAIATNSKIGLAWNNPLDHDGSLLLRSTAGIPNAAPVNGRRYNVGEVPNQADGGVGNATVLYADLQSYASTYGDTGLTNGTRYYYKVFNHDAYNLYSSGDVPTSSGLFAIPTSGAPTSPAWCYSVGLPTPQQPFTDFGKGVYTSSNARAYTGINISTDPTLGGTERWRPAATTGIVQSRPTVTPLFGRTGTYLLGGDQSGFTYAIDVDTGLTVWNGNGGASIGGVQAQAAVQLTQFTDPATDGGAAFRARYPNMDLVFFGTRTASTSTNRIWALSSVDGTQKWSLNPGNLDIISGGMAVDYRNNRLWVASRAGVGGTQPSLRIVDTLNPLAVMPTFNLGDIDDAVTRNSTAGEIYVVTNAGVAYGFDLNTMAQRWSYNLGGAVSGYLVPLGAYGFVASTPAGVQRYTVTANGDGGSTVSPVWAAPPALSGASAARLDAFVAPYKLYVSDSLGRVYRIDFATGAVEASFSVSATALGMPSIDHTTSPRRLFVGGLDGRLCAVDLPF